MVGIRKRAIAGIFNVRNLFIVLTTTVQTDRTAKFFMSTYDQTIARENATPIKF